MKKYIWRVVGVVVLLYLGLVAVRTVHFYKKSKTDEQVTKINATKLTLDDVMGKNLPAVSAEASTSQAGYDATVEGIDINKNGIRDDVELAIFREYPNSAKIRAVLLQYALALQMQFTQPNVNEGVAIAVAQSRSRAAGCIGEFVSRENMQAFILETQKYNDFVKKIQINNEARNLAEADFLKKLGSYADLTGENCDLGISTLPN